MDDFTKNVLRRCLMILKKENLDKPLRMDLEELLYADQYPGSQDELVITPVRKKS